LQTNDTKRQAGLAALWSCQTFCGCGWRYGGWLPVALILLAGGLAAGRAADLGLAETNLIPADASLWDESMLWDRQFILSSGIGYKDNVLLSAFNPRGSAFVDNGVDLMVLRLPLDGWQVTGSLIGDDLRYWHDVGADREDSFISSVEVRRELPRGWQAGLEARGLYEHQVVDTTTSAGTPTAALVDGFGLTGQPFVQKNLPLGFSAKVQLPVTRWLLGPPLDNSWEFGPAATVTWQGGRRTELSFTYGASVQEHDTWVALDAYGRPLPERLQTFQNRYELAWRQYWDADRAWRSATRLSYTDKTDNGGGYFNYHQPAVTEELRWQARGWRVQAEGQMTAQHYPVQGVGILNGETLARTLWSVSGEIERRLSGGLKIYARGEYQQSLSNEALGADSYHATTLSSGVRWEF
jgi:hypothetical protein